MCRKLLMMLVCFSGLQQHLSASLCKMGSPIKVVYSMAARHVTVAALCPTQAPAAGRPRWP